MPLEVAQKIYAQQTRVTTSSCYPPKAKLGEIETIFTAGKVYSVLVMFILVLIFLHVDHNLPMADRPARDRIELSAAARAHALFPVMDFIAAKTASQSQKFNALEANQAKLEQDVTEIKRVLEELHRLVQQTVKNSFSLKESGFEVL